MNEDALLKRIEAAASQDQPACAPATASDVASFEALVEVRLPRFYVRLLTEVGNGGFGPGFGIIGIPPNGYFDDDLRASDLAAAYVSGRQCDERAWRTPRGLIHLCNWGCGTFSYVDALSEDGAVVTDEFVRDRIEYTETAPSLAPWLSDWVAGVNLEEAMHEIVGYGEGLNPFTGQPHRFPERRRRGRRLDLEMRR
jgi:SMI1 / KNR4 family (SUKH-1)